MGVQAATLPLAPPPSPPRLPSSLVPLGVGSETAGPFVSSLPAASLNYA